MLTAIGGASVRSLCGLTEGQTTADFSRQYLSPTDCKIMKAEYDFCGFIAAVAELNISMNPIGVDGAKALAAVIPGSSLQCLIIGPKGTRLPVNNEEVTELNFEGQNFSPAEVTLVAAATSTLAAVARLSLGSNPQIGDEAMVQLLDALKDVSLTSLDISSTGCGISTASKLAELLSGATKFSAALTEVDVRRNMLDEAVLEQLRAAAPETCKILAD